ncbi:hypothetical protein BO70DRAFT_69812 [Aspergillus heteromorphus CBS 117.55]|uniref:Secreted protein n=1 Tax=Aspergillus heteromorphus CBS 117.55 TaxID=1448321 RepID=A0A317VRE7_9EURO|nr:uncharacterized protein BO70DRAFT_69812 [Aspergillus heteromorphus CBS 117.55]PWY76964.1 hypothetical protein BO70DRAFT_69812 [Aspergillus heteromorphus CBS 117.55]
MHGSILTSCVVAFALPLAPITNKETPQQRRHYGDSSESFYTTLEPQVYRAIPTYYRPTCSIPGKELPSKHLVLPTNPTQGFSGQGACIERIPVRMSEPSVPSCALACICAAELPSPNVCARAVRGFLRRDSDRPTDRPTDLLICLRPQKAQYRRVPCC